MAKTKTMKDRAMKVFYEYYDAIPGFWSYFQALNNALSTKTKLPKYEDSVARKVFVAAAILKNIDAGLCCRLTTNLTGCLSEMAQPKGFDLEYKGPKLLGFRYEGKEYLAARLELDDSKGWIVIGNNSQGWFLDHITKLTNVGEPLPESAMDTGSRVMYILSNFAIAWHYGLLLEGSSAEDGPTTVSSPTSSKAANGGELYIHLGKRLKDSYEAQLKEREAWGNQPAVYRAQHWLVRSHFRNHSGNLVEVAAHTRRRDPAKMAELAGAIITL